VLSRALHNKPLAVTISIFAHTESPLAAITVAFFYHTWRRHLTKKQGTRIRPPASSVSTSLFTLSTSFPTLIQTVTIAPVIIVCAAAATFGRPTLHSPSHPARPRSYGIRTVRSSSTHSLALFSRESMSERERSAWTPVRDDGSDTIGGGATLPAIAMPTARTAATSLVAVQTLVKAQR
jgi:hypothetical protein